MQADEPGLGLGQCSCQELLCCHGCLAEREQTECLAWPTGALATVPSHKHKVAYRQEAAGVVVEHLVFSTRLVVHMVGIVGSAANHELSWFVTPRSGRIEQDGESRARNEIQVVGSRPAKRANRRHSVGAIGRDSRDV